jgi:hydroxyacylglutathione hydrolase
MKLANNLFFYPDYGDLDCNTYVFTGKPGIVIDPGNPEYLSGKVTQMRAEGVAPEEIGYIVNTHLHLDHSAANNAFRELSGAKLALLPVQVENYFPVVIEGAQMLGMTPTEFKADMTLDNSKFKVGAIELELFLAPGHSPECVCFYYRPLKVLICGDVMFEMNTGRVDLPGGDADALKKSIDNLSKLDIELLLPGHMGMVTGAAQVKRNFDFIKANVYPWL